MPRKRKSRSHPGVRLKKRTRDGTWRVAYKPPGSNTDKYETLPPSLTTAAQREAFACNLWNKIKLETLSQDLGKTRPVDQVLIGTAIARYIESASATLAPRTLTIYGEAHRLLESWASESGVRYTSELTTASLAALRDFLARLPKRAAVAGGKRGERTALSSRRSAITVNVDLRALKTLMQDWRRRGILKWLTSDDISDGLRPLNVPQNPPKYLTAPDLRRLFQAAARHDAATFATTRDEKRGLRSLGTTWRFEPIAPFIAFVLLTGMRKSEALGVEWSMVKLDALDNDGKRVGEIHLPSDLTKTNHGRIIRLDVSHWLRRNLGTRCLAAGGTGRVNASHTADTIKAARRRLRKSFGAPSFSWQMLRSTCSTYLTNAPGIFGGASAYLSAAQLGHSVAVAERHYIGLTRGISHDARTLEAAMQIKDMLPPTPGRVSVAQKDLTV